MLLCGLFYEAIFLCLTLCYFILLLFRPFSIAITALGEERANLSDFRTLVRFVLFFGFVGFIYLLVSGKGCHGKKGHWLSIF